MKLDLSSAGESPSCLSAADAEAAPEAERPGSFSAPSPLAAAATELSLDEGGGSGLPIDRFLEVQVHLGSPSGSHLSSKFKHSALGLSCLLSAAVASRSLGTTWRDTDVGANSILTSRY